MTTSWVCLLLAASGLLAQTADWRQEIDRAKQLVSTGWYGAAADTYQAAFRTAERLGLETAELTTEMLRAANIFLAIGRYREAERLSRRCLAISSRLFGPDNPATAIALNNLGTISREQGMVSKARSLFAEAAAMLRRCEATDSALLSTVLANLATAYQLLGAEAQAQSCYESALDALGSAVDSPQGAVARAVILTNMATLRRQRGEPRAALGLLEQAGAAYARTLPPVHPYTARYLINLAMVLADLQERDQAELRFRQGLALYETICGPDHPGTLPGLELYAKFLRHAARKKEAGALEKRIGRIRAGSPEVDVSRYVLEGGAYGARR
jgi:tetratricopeptide (TPR) repeat protein